MCVKEGKLTGAFLLEWKGHISWKNDCRSGQRQFACRRQSTACFCEWKSMCRQWGRQLLPFWWRRGGVNQIETWFILCCTLQSISAKSGFTLYSELVVFFADNASPTSTYLPPSPHHPVFKLPQLRFHQKLQLQISDLILFCMNPFIIYSSSFWWEPQYFWKCSNFKFLTSYSWNSVACRK